MNSPPNSISRHPNGCQASISPKSPRSRVRIPTVSHSNEDEEDESDEPTPITDRFRPPSPSPSSSTTSPLAAGSIQAAALIESIERGDYAPNDLDETRSLTDSIRQHVVDGGLRYHAYHAGKYLFPNDEAEQDREELKHNLCVYLCDGEYFVAPVRDLLEKGGEVLDLGTGIGKWCIDLADNYPNSTFHGMDLSPIQPDWVPENALFVVDDIEHEAGWTYPEDKFDYIHMRHTVHSIRDRALLWDRIYKHLKPGGYIEVQEFHYIPACDDESCDGPYAWRDFLRYLQDGMAALGTDIHGITYVEDELLDAGFEGLTRKNHKCPVGPWPKKTRLQECGHIMRDVVMWGLVGLARKPLRDGLKWTLIQIEMFLVEVRKSLTEDTNGLPIRHTYFPFHSIYARKPLNPTEAASRSPSKEEA
ncbi:hypothetical protein FZEAL_956 [Fusarium zealandicum]|uniref:Methyltransferase n=1 Tax=Fusarium zealandicum TaxID=1053134 RepID=A0A8H4UTP8_9HYPO|nr:hypothetical protein FZEAL_956 [Fusarium zealandicum]